MSNLINKVGYYFLDPLFEITGITLIVDGLVEKNYGRVGYGVGMSLIGMITGRVDHQAILDKRLSELEQKLTEKKPNKE